MLLLTGGEPTCVFELLADAPASWLRESEECAAREEPNGGLASQDKVLNELTRKLTLAVTTTLVFPAKTEGVPCFSPRCLPGALMSKTHLKVCCAVCTTDFPAIPCNCDLQDIRDLPVTSESEEVLPTPSEHIPSNPHLPRCPTAEYVSSAPFRCADDLGQPPLHIIGACSISVVVPRCLAKSRLETLQEAAVAAGREQQQPQPQRVWEDFQLRWYTQAAVVFQPEAAAAPADPRDPQSCTAAGAGGKCRDRQDLGGAAAALAAAAATTCSSNNKDETSGSDEDRDTEGVRAAASMPGSASCTARLCYVHGGIPSQMSQPVERGIKRAAWEEYGMKVLEVCCGKDGKGTLLYGFTNDLYTAGDARSWSLSHVVLNVFLDARPLQVVQSQLALAGDYRLLPRRIMQLTPGTETQMVHAAMTGALADAKAQLHAAIAAHGTAGAFRTGNLLMGRLETRLNVSVPVVADALASITLRAYNPNLAPYACRLLNCQAGGLADALYNKLHDNITRYMAEAEAAREATKASRKRGRGRDNGGCENEEEAGRGYGDAGDGTDGSYEVRTEGGDLLVLAADAGSGEKADYYDIEDEVDRVADDGHVWDEEDGLVAVEGGYGWEEEEDGNGPAVMAGVQVVTTVADSDVLTEADAALLTTQKGQSAGAEERVTAAGSAAAEQDIGCQSTVAPGRDAACRPNLRQVMHMKQQQSHRPRHAVEAVGALLGARPLRTVVIEEGEEGQGEDDWAF